MDLDLYNSVHSSWIYVWFRVYNFGRISRKMANPGKNDSSQMSQRDDSKGEKWNRVAIKDGLL